MSGALLTVRIREEQDIVATRQRARQMHGQRIGQRADPIPIARISDNQGDPRLRRRHRGEPQTYPQGEGQDPVHGTYTQRMTWVDPGGDPCKLIAYRAAVQEPGTGPSPTATTAPLQF